MPTVFISYSQDSDEHNARVLELANRLRADGIDATIDQYESSPPEGWPKWMDRLVAKSDFVIVICTETFYDRVMGEEEKGKGRGIKWESTLTYQHIYDNDSLNTRFIPLLFEDGKDKYIPTPLKGATHYRLPQNYEKLYRRLTNQPETIKPELGKLKSLPPLKRKTDFLGIKVSLTHLPSTSSDLFGREKELKQLDDAWENDDINILSLVAWGGVGKTALVNKWLSLLGESYRGAERVYGWSFYSQGAAEGRQVSADQFIAAALTWFGDPEMANSAASPWDKGERLAELIKQQRTLLILDGLEPLQNPPPIETGRIKDPGLTSLLRELARQNPGLVVISTRLAVDDLKDFIGSTALEIDLESLSDEAGAAYLEYLGVDGPDEERQEASKDFGGHALALTLLGRYLKVVHGGDIRKRKEIPHMMDEQKQGAHARRVMESYEAFLTDKPELDILRLMGLFDRPAEGGALVALKKEPIIDGLTDALQKLSDADWRYAINNLRDLRLLAEQNPQEPESLDCHPLLREHFSGKLKTGNPEAWRKGHSRLFEYYSLTARVLPRTIEEMAPLYAAVMHGCQAGRYQEALNDVFIKRIQRGKEFFNKRKLGAFGSELSVLSGFFDLPWQRLVSTISDTQKAYILSEVGSDLDALGRLEDATHSMQAGLDFAIAQNDLGNAAAAAANLGETIQTIGDLKKATDVARQSVDLANRSGNWQAKIMSRVCMGTILYQTGQFTEAIDIFNEAESIQKLNQPSMPFLYAGQGFEFRNLLLSQGKIQEVQQQAAQALKQLTSNPNVPIMILAFENLSLGRAHLLQSQNDPNHPLDESIRYINQAVDGLRHANDLAYLPHSLLTRAVFYRVTNDLNNAKKDLDEAFTIATRGGMGLYLADCHLEYGRLYLAQNEKNKAREHWEIAKKSINEMGYHRRDKEVQELEEQLK